MKREERETERERKQRKAKYRKYYYPPPHSLTKRGYHGPLQQYSGDAQHEVENESGFRLSPFIRPVSLKQRPPKDREPTFFPPRCARPFSPVEEKKKCTPPCLRAVVGGGNGVLWAEGAGRVTSSRRFSNGPLKGGET